MSIVRKIARGARRLGWGVADQAFSSLTNSLLGIMIARSVSPREFGAFALVFAVYTAVLGGARALNSQPFMVRHTSEDREIDPLATGRTTGASLLIGIVAGIVSVVVGLFVPGMVGATLIAMGVTMPGLILQDAWRWVFFGTKRSGGAFANDVVWAVAMFVGFAGLIVTDRTSVAAFTLVWGAGAAVAAIFGLFQAGVLPRPASAWKWWKSTRDLGLHFTGEYAATEGTVQLTFFTITAIVGLAALGGIRGASMLFGPFQVFALGVGMVTIPEAVRALRRSRASLRRTILALSLGMAVAALVFGGLMLLLPTGAGRALLGRSWDIARDLIVPTAVMRAAFAFGGTAVAGLRALQAARRSFYVRVAVAPLSIVGGVTGALLGGAEGATWGLAIVRLFAAAIWWWQFRIALARYEPSESAEPPPGMDEATSDLQV